MAVDLRAFRPSVDKVYHVDVHPTQPWVASSDGRDNVVVWDWEHGQILYELNAGGVDERRLVDAQLQRMADGEEGKGSRSGGEAIRGGGVKDVRFFDDDVRYWTAWLGRSALSESPTVTSGGLPLPPIGGCPAAIRGRRFLVLCCENKAIILDLVTRRTKDVPRVLLDNRSPLCVEFLPATRGAAADGPFAAFGAPDGAIRVLSLSSWNVVRKLAGGHKGAVHCLLSFVAGNGEVILASGGADGHLTMWGTDGGQPQQQQQVQPQQAPGAAGGAAGAAGYREIAPKLVITKAHDGGVIGISMVRVMGSSPQLITCGGDKSVAWWDTNIFKELRRLKHAIPKMVCHSVAAWSHPRVPTVIALACAKDSHVWAIDVAVGAARPLCDLAAYVPPTPQVAAGKKLKVYCMLPHPLQPHLVVTGTNVGVLITSFDRRAVPPAVALPPRVAPSPSATPAFEQHTAVFLQGRHLNTLTFQAVPTVGPRGGGPEGSGGKDEFEIPGFKVKQSRMRMQVSGHDAYATLAVSKSGRYLSVLWQEIPFFQVMRTADWSVVDSGAARLLAWDVCKDRYATLGGAVVPKVQRTSSGKKGGPFRGPKAKEQKDAEVAAAAAAAAAAAVLAVATVEVKALDSQGRMRMLCGAVETGRKEQVVAMHSGAMLGIAYRVPKRAVAPGDANVPPTAASAVGAAAMQGGSATLEQVAFDSSSEKLAQYMEQPLNFQFISWETFKPMSSSLLPQPEWSAWDPVVEYCAMAYEHDVAIATLRPQFRCLGRVAVQGATGGVWQRRQLFLATPTSVECVFVDAGVSEIDVETRRRKAARKRAAEEAKVVAEKGELALLTMEAPKEEAPERVQLRPPMLQVVRLASFSSTPAVPPISAMARAMINMSMSVQTGGTDPSAAHGGLLEGLGESRPPEMAVAGGGIPVASGRLPGEQRRPVGPMYVVGVRDGILWLIDRYFTAHAIQLVHPGVRCRCLAAYGDPVGAVKWASRLGREHQDDLAKFMVGMGYAREALHLPGLSKRFEYELAMQCGELDRALASLEALSRPPRWSAAGTFMQDSSAAAAAAAAAAVPNILQADLAYDSTGVLAMAESQANMMEAAAGVVAHAKEYLNVIDAADATAQADVAVRALRKLAGAGLLEGGLSPYDHRRLALRLATHGEGTRLQMHVAALVRSGFGREAANGAALLGDANQLEKTWHDSGLLPEAALHAQCHGRPTLTALMQQWNKQLVKAEAALTASQLLQSAHFQTLFGNLEKQEDPWEVLTPSNKEPPIQVVPPKEFEAAATSPAAAAGRLAAAGVDASGLGSFSAVPGGPGSVPGGGGFGGYGYSAAVLAARPTGVQGMAQPLDLSVLEGKGKTGPVPQKAAAVAVPVIFSAFTAGTGPASAATAAPAGAPVTDNLFADFVPGVLATAAASGGAAGSNQLQSKPPAQQQQQAQQPPPAKAAAASSAPAKPAAAAVPAKGTGTDASPAGAASSRDGAMSRGGVFQGPTMADLEWAALEATK